MPRACVCVVMGRYFETLDLHNNQLTGTVPSTLLDTLVCEDFISNCFNGACAVPQSPHC